MAKRLRGTRIACAALLSAALLSAAALTTGLAFGQSKGALTWRDLSEPDGTCVTRQQLAQAEPEPPPAGVKPDAKAESQAQPAPGDEKPAEESGKSPADPTLDSPVKPEVRPRVPAKPREPEPVIRPAASAPELLRSLGVDPSHYEMLVDGQDIDAAEDEALLKFMYAVRRFRTMHIFKWISAKPDLAALRDKPDDHRGEIVRLVGHVTQVSLQRPLPEQVARFELSHFYRCEFTIAPTAESKASRPEVGSLEELAAPPLPTTALVFTPTLPKAWISLQAVAPEKGWRASVEGFFLKVGPEGRLVFVAQRIAWHPPGLLGDLGMDLGMFDEIPTGPLGPADREAFYQMLNALGQVGTQELARRTQIRPGATTFANGHVREWKELARSLAAQGSPLESSGAQEVYRRLPEPLRKQLEVHPPGTIPAETLQAECYSAFNTMISDPELFDARAWQGSRIAAEADNLLHKAMQRQMSTAELRVLNRRLIETAFPSEIAAGQGGSIQADQITNMSSLAHRIRLEARQPTPKPGKRMFAGFSTGLQNALRDLPEGTPPDAALGTRLVAAINSILDNPNLYDSVAWSTHPLPEDAAQSLENLAANLPVAELQRFNRLLMEAAFPEMIAQSHRYSVVPLFTQPDKQIGRLVALEGICRRALRVPVDDPDIRERFQIDHYYELQLFTDDSQSNPVTFCVRSLPAGMPQGEKIAIKLRVAGFFFKTWSYSVPLTPERRKEILKRLPADRREKFKAEDFERFHAPLMIGRQPVWLREPPVASSPVGGLVAGALFVAALLVAWISLWVANRGDQKFKASTLDRQYDLEPGANLDKVGLEMAPEADFRNYDPEVAAAQAQAAALAGTVAVPSRVGKRYYVRRNSPMMWVGGGFSRKLFGSNPGENADLPRRSGDNIFQGVVGNEKTRVSPVRSVAVFVVPMFLLVGLYMLLRFFSQTAPGSHANPPPTSVRSAPAKAPATAPAEPAIE